MHRVKETQQCVCQSLSLRSLGGAAQTIRDWNSCLQALQALIQVVRMLLAAMPGAPSSFLLLVAMPVAPSSVLIYHTCKVSKDS